MEENRKALLLKWLKKKINKPDEDIDFLLKRVISHFLNYTNLSKVPKEADVLIYDMAISLATDEGLIAFDSKVKQIKRGDTAITYGDSKVLSSFFSGYETRLNHFRTLNIPKVGGKSE